MAAEITDPHGIPQAFGGVTYGSPLSYDVVQPDYYSSIASITWFSRTAVQADTENYFEQLALYGRDGQFYWGVHVVAFSSCVWSDIVAVDDIYFAYYGSTESKRRRHVVEVAKLMVALPTGPLVEEGVDGDIWRYR